MRALIALIVIVLLMALVGWISFSTGPDRSSINVEQQEIKEDTREMLEAGNQVIDRARDSIDDSENDDQENVEDRDVRPSDLPTSEPGPVDTR